ncbi:B-cell linker protein isoform X2 [Takifugu rubripes]|uniref:B-cell linker protein isoform X2 n=1 Tax=Takifugu rubripes TaxID=31033 RepID=UPI0011455381|nr:B-cell linker protein-like isoform X2 [Takifugu rubripes]
MAMGFFGKLKGSHSGPPAPARRTENNVGWPQGDYGHEDGDTYEAPPCQRAAVKVPQRQLADNVYLERSVAKPAVPQRQAPPPPTSGRFVKSHQQAEDPFNDPNGRKPPAIDRNEKPGKKRLLLPPVQSLPPPPVEEDVYLDPNEEQEEDDVYLEPTEACSPAPHRPMRTTPSPQTHFGAPAAPMVKPPVPRAKSHSTLPSLNVEKTAEMRRATLAATLPPPPAPSVRPPPPVNMEAKVREERLESSPIPVADTRTAVLPSGVRTTKQSGTEGKEWFAGDCNRKTAEALLLRVKKDGAFLIRHSSAQSSRQPYTLAVLYENKVYNIPIRFLEELRGYALGKEGKTNEEIFCTLDEMISHHQQNRLLLINSQSQAKHTTFLTHPACP